MVDIQKYNFNLEEESIKEIDDFISILKPKYTDRTHFLKVAIKLLIDKEKFSQNEVMGVSKVKEDEDELVHNS